MAKTAIAIYLLLLLSYVNTCLAKICLKTYSNSRTGSAASSSFCVFPSISPGLVCPSISRVGFSPVSSLRRFIIDCCRHMNHPKAAKARTPTATPTPIPASAPLLRFDAGTRVDDDNGTPDPEDRLRRDEVELAWDVEGGGVITDGYLEMLEGGTSLY